MKIRKKTWPDLYEKVLNGEKTFDARIADFDCKPGDILILEEWDPQTEEYTGRKIEKKITFVMNTKDITFWKKQDLEKYGLQIIAFQ